MLIIVDTDIFIIISGDPHGRRRFFFAINIAIVLIDQIKGTEEDHRSITRLRKLNVPRKEDRGVIVRGFLRCGRRYIPWRFDRYCCRVALAIVLGQRMLVCFFAMLLL